MECSGCEVDSDIVGQLVPVKAHDGKKEITIQVCSYCKQAMGVTDENKPGNSVA